MVTKDCLLRQPACLDPNEVAGFMIFVFTEDINFGVFHPIFFQSWADVYDFAFKASLQRRKLVEQGHSFTTGSDVAERLMMWLIVHKKSY